MLSSPWTSRAAGAFAIMTMMIAAPASAQQPTPPSPAPSEQPAETEKPSLLPPGLMLGPGMMRGGMIRRMCDPRGFGLSGWRIERLQRALELTDEQRKKLDDAVTASAKAVEQFIADCPRELPLTPAGRLEMLEARFAAMLESVRTLRSAFAPFYASLSDEQKARLTPDAQGRRWRFERWGDEEREGRRGRRRR